MSSRTVCLRITTEERGNLLWRLQFLDTIWQLMNSQ